MKFRLRRGPALGLVALLFVGVLPVTASAQSIAGAQSLQIPPGARAEGMGRFFSAVASDAFAPWWNPAGLAFNKGWNAGLMHAQLVPGLADDVFFEYLGVSKDISGWGTLAGTFTYLNYGESFATEAGNPDPTATFSSYEFSPSVALGTPIIPNLGLGANLKLVHVNLTSGLSSVTGGRGTTFAVDVGALYRWQQEKASLFGGAPGTMGINAGLTFANLGPDISLVDENRSDPLPRNMKLGVAFEARSPGSYSVLVGGAIEKSLVGGEAIPDSILNELSFAERNDLQYTGGLELGILDLLYGRLGYIFDDVGEIKGTTFGAGFYLKQFGLDWASIPQFRELDRVNKFSIVARF